MKLSGARVDEVHIIDKTINKDASMTNAEIEECLESNEEELMREEEVVEHYKELAEAALADKCKRLLGLPGQR